jgi:Ser-tRNA(Ala) deacylase AlaX
MLKKKENKTLEKKRTMQQNAALHLFFTQLAEALNSAGFDMKKTIREGIDIPWTPENVKEFLWRPVQKALLQKQSTTELNKKEEIDKIYDILNKVIGERTGVHIPFPSIDTAMDAEREKELKN